MDRRTALVMMTTGIAATVMPHIARAEEGNDGVPDALPRRHAEITEFLRQQGAHVTWSMPDDPECIDNNPMFIVRSSHFSELDNLPQAEGHTEAMVAEYRLLEALASQGMRTFAFEGLPSNEKSTPATVLLHLNEEGEPTAYEAYVGAIPESRKDLPKATPKQVREVFDDDRILTIEFNKGKDSPVQSIFSASYPEVRCIGAEDPKTYQRLKQYVEQVYVPALKTEREFFAHLAELQEGKGNRLGITPYFDRDDQLQVIELGGKKFDVQDLERMARVLTETEAEYADIIIRDREKYVSTQPEADVTYFGADHDFTDDSAVRPLGIVTSAATAKLLKANEEKPNTEISKGLLRMIEQLRRQKSE